MFAIALLLTRSAAPVVDLPSPVTTLGQATPITVHVGDPHGVRTLAAFVEQNGARYRVWEIAQPSRATDGTWNFTAGVKTAPQLKDGKAKLILEATSNGLLRKTAHWEREVTVVTRPPIVSVRFRPTLPIPGYGRSSDLQCFWYLVRSGRACRRSDLSGLAHARRQAWLLFALCLCLEHAVRHSPAGLRLQWRGERRDQPDRIPVSQEGAAEVHRPRLAGERPVHAEGSRRAGSRMARAIRCRVL